MDNTNKKILTLFVGAFIIYIGMLSVIPMTEPSEARYSLIASSMATSGDFVTPMLKGAPYLEKPPLVYWATATFFKLFGESDLTSRLFSALCAWGCVLLVFLMGSYFHNRKTGIYSAAVLAFCVFHFLVGRLNLLDMPLAFFVSTATWFGYRYFADTGKNKCLIYGFYIACALSFLTKGLIGIIFPGAIIVFWLLFMRRWRDLLQLISPVGILLFLLVSIPWIILVQKAQSDFLYFFFIHEHFVRYATKVHSRYQPFYFFIPIVIAGVIPWLGYIPQALKAFKTRMTDYLTKDEMVFLFTWSGLIFFFFSISSSKLVPYIAPLFPPLAVMLGYMFCKYDELAIDAETKSFCRDCLPQILQSLLLLIGIAIAVIREKDNIRSDSFLFWVIPPIILILLLAFLPNYLRGRYGKGWFVTIATLSFLFMLSLIYPASIFLTPYKTAIPAVAAMEHYLPATETLYQFRTNIYGVDFYSKKRTAIIDDFGEVGQGAKKLSLAEQEKYFLLSKDAIALYKKGKTLFVLVENEDKYASLRAEMLDGELLWYNGKYYFARLKKKQ